MSDPKDELGARFDDRRPDTDEPDESGHVNDSDNTGGADDTSGADNTDDSDNTGDAGNSNGVDNSEDSNTSSDSDNTGNSGNKPGPDPNKNATRHRRQVPMYLPDEKADSLNTLYEQLDGRSKIAGDGGIEKHADFMEVMVDFVVEHEDELAIRLGIE